MEKKKKKCIFSPNYPNKIIIIKIILRR